MAEKILNSRLIQKHDTEENWNKAVNFIPRQGEVIVYDIDDYYSYERIKVGDGVTVAHGLPFVNEIPEEDTRNQYPNIRKIGQIVDEKTGKDWPINVVTSINAVREGTGAPSHTNIRPITGWGEINVNRGIYNVLELPETQVNKEGVIITGNKFTYTLNGDHFSASSGYVPLQDVSIAAGTYSFSCEVISGEAKGLADNASLMYVQVGNAHYRQYVDSKEPVTFTVNEASTYSLHMVLGTNVEYKDFTLLPILKRVTPAPTTDFYREVEVFTSSLPEVNYGGKFNWSTGELITTHKVFTLDGTEDWQTTLKGGAITYYYIRAGELNTYIERSGFSSHFPAVQISSNNTAFGFMIANSSSGEDRILIRPDLTTYDSLDTWKAYLAAQNTAGTPVQVVVAYTTPQVEQLEGQEILGLMGQNVLWSNCGPVEGCFNFSLSNAATKDYVVSKIEESLPAPTINDANKFLRVNAEGNYELVAIARAEEATF